MLLGLDHVVIFVNNLERAKVFYREAFGLGVVVDVPGFVGLLAGGQMLGLHPTETGGKDVGSGPLPYFRVHDMETTLTQLRARDVHIHSGPVRMPSGDVIATIHDSEGNAIGLVQKP